jgi:pimeloyl-ACP methyl ester carboxylesterase
VGPQPSSRGAALAWLDAAIASAGPVPTVLVGHTLAGYLSLCRTVIDPTGIAGLVLLSTGPGFRDPARREQWRTFIADDADRHGIPEGVGGSPSSPTRSPAARGWAGPVGGHAGAEGVHPPVISWPMIRPSSRPMAAR